jgi:hypothetical protein
MADRYIDSETTHQLLGRLIERTEYLIKDIQGFKGELAANAIRTEARLIALELKSAEYAGGTRMLLMFGGIAATVGGLVATLITKLWP